MAFAITAAWPAGAGVEGLHLTWNDCWMGASATSDASFDCLTNLDERLLLVAFTLAQPLDSVIAAEVVIDIQHENPTLPAWWQFQTGGCRLGSLSVSGDIAGLACAPTWGPAAIGLLQDYAIGQPRGGANQARIRAVVAVPSDSARSLTDTDAYAAAVLTLDARKSTKLGSCPGCTTNACLVLNSILLRRLPGGSGDRYLETPAAGNGNWVTWGGAAAGACVAVPVRAVTWGQIKSLYR